MKLVDQWRAIQEGLPGGVVGGPAEADRPSSARPAPGRSGARRDQRRAKVGQALAFEVHRAGANSAQKAAHLFERLDDERTWCQLEVSDVAVADTSAWPRRHRRREVRPVAETWDAALGDAPVRLERPPLRDRDLLERPPRPDGAPLRAGQPHPRRLADGVHLPLLGGCGLRRLGVDGAALLRAARRRKRIEGVTRVLRVLSDTDVVATQGPVWLVGGKMW